MSRDRLIAIALASPALALVAALFIYPLAFSVVTAFETETAFPTLANFVKAWEFYSLDIWFTLVIVGLSVAGIGLLAIAIAGTLTLSDSQRIIAALRWLYRWPLFIPFIVAAQCMRTFLAKNGLMNNLFVSMGLYGPLASPSFLDWRGITITFIWKQTPFVALLLAGAMASIDRGTIEAARGLGAGRIRILFEIVLPQVRPTLVVGLILSFVIIMSVLSVPLMIGSGTPNMLTVDMAFRINAYGDYGVANALGLVSYLMCGAVAWIYLRRGLQEGGHP